MIVTANTGIVIGNQSSSCQSSLPIPDAPNGLAGPDGNGVGCDMTGGVSGGGWIKTLRRVLRLNSQNDYKYSFAFQPKAMYSPYYGDDLHSLWNDAQAGNP